MILLAAASAAAAQAPPGIPPVITPRIIVQALGQGGFDVAAWTADSRFVFTASGLRRELLLWDVAAGVIVDRVRLPSQAGTIAEVMNLNSMALLPDGRTLHIEGVVLDPGSADLRAPRAYAVDVRTRQARQITARPLAPLAPGTDWLGMMQRRLQAMAVAHSKGDGGGAEMPRAEAERLLPALPRSPDGRWQLHRLGPGFVMNDAAGQLKGVRSTWRPLASIDDADLSADERRLAMVTTVFDAPSAASPLPDSANRTQIETFDLTQGRFLASLRLAGRYDAVRWISSSRFYVLPQEAAKTAPVVLYDADAGREVTRLPARCFMVPLPDGGLLGAGLANCHRDAGADRAVARLVNGVWQPLPGLALTEGKAVRLLAASPGGDRLAAVIRMQDGRQLIAVADAGTGSVLQSLDLPASVDPTRIGFAPDGRLLWVAASGTMLEWDTSLPPGADGKAVGRRLPVISAMPGRFAAQGSRLLVGGALEDRIEVVDLATGTSLAPIAFPGAAAIGFMQGRPVFWAASTTDGLRLWNSRTGQVLMTIALLPDQRYVVAAGDGRYDTNLGPESESFRWFMPDEPFQSLPPQTLMRDYYEPQLISKLMDCTAAGNCARVLPPAPPVAGLNRLLPQVRITDVRPADTPGQVVVRVEARETRDAQSGRRSGLFNVKLLLDNRQIDQQPPHFQQQPSPTLTEWRELNQMEGVNAAGLWSSEFQVSVPTHHNGKPMEFAAYAFNSDRVKSDTTRRNWTPPGTSTPKRPRRAWVLTIGVDDYVEPRLLDLNFAVADARVIADRLAAIPGYEMRHISLTSAAAADGRPARQVTRADVLGVLSYLAGFPPEMDQMIRLEDVHKVRSLAETTPDDIIIISFSGHGFATASGQFALLPSTARWPATAAAPETRSVITAEDLTIQLGFMKAAEIAFIIDACHSGAAVNTPDFKPGPMGDASLGQLAFDKGLRILAATQADDVALENASLQQGFLTAALGEGLTDQGGPADLNANGQIQLDEWLRYAAQRLPSLEAEVRRGGSINLARGVRLVMRAPAAAKRQSQEPSLFDFNSAPSPVVLRGRPNP